VTNEAIRPKKKRKGLIALILVTSCVTGIIGGAIGGAAGAIWVVETMAKPRFSPKVKNAVIEYEMPAEGARPVDIAGINKIGTPLHPCAIGFMEENRELLPHADWSAVRFNPYFKIDGDIITEMAFARRAAAITRGNEITVRVVDAPENFDVLTERLFFHELVHVDQYASGRMDLPDYAASAANAYANGRNAHDNGYEKEAAEKADVLRKAWKISGWRQKCHPDVKENTEGKAAKRSASERPMVKYAIFDRDTQEYRVVEHVMHNPGKSPATLTAVAKSVTESVAQR